MNMAATVPGHMGLEELEWLRVRAAGCAMIAEVGSWKGRSTMALCEGAAGLVFAVDTWDGSLEQRDELAGKPPWWLYREFLSNLRAYLGVKLIPMRMASAWAAAHFGAWGVFFDMVFIDAEHDYGNVKYDLLSWAPLVRPGGLLCGHDFRDDQPGVVEAVKQFVPGYKLVGGNTSIWYAEIPK